LETKTAKEIEMFETSFDSTASAVERKLMSSNTNRDKSISQLRRIANRIFMNERQAKFDKEYFSKINEKYMDESKKNFSKALKTNLQKYRYKPKDPDEIQKEMDSIQFPMNMSYDKRQDQSFGIVKSPNGSILNEGIGNTSITIKCIENAGLNMPKDTNNSLGTSASKRKVFV